MPAGPEALCPVELAHTAESAEMVQSGNGLIVTSLVQVLLQPVEVLVTVTCKVTVVVEPGVGLQDIELPVVLPEMEPWSMDQL